MSLFATMPFVERFRPSSWEQVIGQEKVVRQIRQLASRGALGGRAYWLSGPSGTGKTTIARLIAAEISGPWGTEEIDAGALTVAKLAEIERSCQSRDMFSADKGGKAFIVNEAHGLARPVVRQLLVMLERLPAHVAVIFTTTNDGQQLLLDGSEDGGPLLSRCLPLPLARRGLAKPFAQFLQRVAREEGLDGKDISAYMRLVEDNHNNLRAGLQAIEAGAMQGE